MAESERAQGHLLRPKEILQKIFDDAPRSDRLRGEHGRLLLANREREQARGRSIEEMCDQNLGVLAES